jgi:hypothetical protein
MKFKHLISPTLRKKRRYVKMWRPVEFTKGNIRQIIYRRQSKGKIQATEL